MPLRLAFAGFALVTFVYSSVPAAEEQGPRPVADSLAPEMFLVITIPSCQRTAERVAKCPLGRIGAERGIASHVAAAKAILADLWAEETGFQDLREGLEVAGLTGAKLLEIVSGELTVAFGDLKSLDLGGEPDLIVVLGAGAEAPKLQEALDLLAAFALQDPDAAVNAIEHAGVRMNVFSEPGGRALLCIAMHRGRLILATRRQRLEQLLDALADGDARTIRDQPWHARFEEQLGGVPADLAIHVNRPDAAALTQARVSSRAIQTLFQVLAAQNLAAVHYGVSFGKERVRETVLLRAEDGNLAGRGGGPIFRPVEDEALKALPRGTFAALVTRVSLKDLLLTAERIVDLVTQPGLFRMSVGGGLAMMGLNLDQHLVGALDGHLALTASLPTHEGGMPVTLVPDLLLSLGVKDTAAADQLIAGVQGGLENLPSIQVRKLKAGGHRYVVVPRVGARKAQISPSFGRLESRLLVSLWAESLKRQLAGGDTGRRLTDWQEFKALREQIGKGASLLVYADSRALVTFLANTLVWVTHVETRTPPIDLLKLPDGSALARHLVGTMLAMHSSEDGTVLTALSPSGLLPAGGLAALAAAYLDVVTLRSRARTRLRRLHRGIAAFKGRHGRAPARLSELYPDTVRSSATFTLRRYVRWSRRRGRMQWVRQRIEREGAFVYLPDQLGKAGGPLLSVKLPYKEPISLPVMMGDGKVVQMRPSQLDEILREVGYDAQEPRPTQAPPARRPAPPADEDPF